MANLKRGDVVQRSPDIDNVNYHGCIIVVMVVNHDGNDGTHLGALVGANCEHHWIGFKEEDVEYIGVTKFIPEIEWMPFISARGN